MGLNIKQLTRESFIEMLERNGEAHLRNQYGTLIAVIKYLYIEIDEEDEDKIYLVVYSASDDCVYIKYNTVLGASEEKTEDRVIVYV
jgi:hypothetical protein